MVVSHQVSASEYASALVEIAAGIVSPAPSVGVPMLGRSAIEQRVRAILAEAPWRGRFGWAAKGLIACAAVAAVLASGLGLRPTTAHAEAAKPLAPASRQLAEHTVQALQKRVEQLRMIHFTMEQSPSEKDVATGRTLNSPQPSVIEAWVDEAGRRYRANYRPQVTRWTNGAGPFFVENLTDASDGRQSWEHREMDNVENIVPRPAGSLSLIGMDHEREALGILQRMLKGGPSLWINEDLEISETSMEGHPLVRLEQKQSDKGAVSNIKTWDFDPKQDGMLTSYALTYPGAGDVSAMEWKLHETARTSTGIAYPRTFRFTYRRAKTVDVLASKVLSLESIQDIPAALLVLPKAAKDPYAAADSNPVQGSEVELRYVHANDGSPVPNVAVHYEINGGERVKTAANEQGVVHIPLPKEEVRYLNTWGISKGQVMQSVILSRGTTPLRLPVSYTVKLHAASPIGGRIVNENDQPVEGVQVSVLHTGLPRQRSVLSDGYANQDRTTSTNAKGEWQMQGFADDLAGLLIRTSHPDYQSGMYSDYRYLTNTNHSTLRDGSSRLVLKRGLSLSGIVVDQQNQPVAGCSLVLATDRWGSHPPTTKTGPDGSFTFKALKAGKQWLTAEAARHQPSMQEINVAGSNEPLRIVLASGKVLRGRIVREDGQPAGKTRVVANRWRDKRTLQFDVWTDKEGRFVWDGAPVDEVKFDLLVDQGPILRDRPLTATDEEQTIVMRPALRIQGTVVDAISGRPVKLFSVVKGRLYSEKDIGWDSETRRTFHDGVFEWTSDWLNQAMLLKVEAEGYQPLQTSWFQPKGQTEQISLKLVPQVN